jgi:transglutaminase-like putative cysteine protease
MNAITRASAAIFAVLILVAAAPVHALDTSRLPTCWTVRSTYDADTASLKGFGTRFDADLEALSNVKIDAGGIPLQINEVVCRTLEDASAVYRFFMSAREATPMKYGYNGNVVYEILCDNYGVSAKVQDLFGLRKGTWRRSYRVTVGVAPLEQNDGMRWNALFNAFLTGEGVDTLAAHFRFGSSLRVPHTRAEWGTPSYEFSLDPASESERGDFVEVTFGELPRTEGVPRLGMVATVPVSAFTPYQPPDPVNTYRLTRATAAWPTDDPRVADALAGIGDDWTPRRKIEHIACWVFENIRFDGAVTGSRYGTIKVLEQGYGHCWDKADVFVTLCRAAGIAAREVMGWLIVEEAGHVWAQAYDPDSGWISVDATASWIGVDERYIPLFILEDGRTPVVYTSKPVWDALPPDAETR